MPYLDDEELAVLRDHIRDDPILGQDPSIAERLELVVGLSDLDQRVFIISMTVFSELRGPHDATAILRELKIAFDDPKASCERIRAAGLYAPSCTLLSEN
jgi:hypothetical protein